MFHLADVVFLGLPQAVRQRQTVLAAALMRPHLPHIRVCMADHAACSRRARACLAAAAALARNHAAVLCAAADNARMARMTHALIQSVLSQKGETNAVPSVRPILTDAVTPKGELCLIGENAQPRVFRLLAHWGMDMTPILREISLAARMAGYDVEEHLCPTVPDRLLHLTIPALGTLITSSDILSSEQTFDFSSCIPQGALLRYECALEQGRAGIRLHLHRAIAALTQAKQLHDELESFYVPNMDFGRWQEILEETLDTLQPAD